MSLGLCVVVCKWCTSLLPVKERKVTKVSKTPVLTTKMAKKNIEYNIELEEETNCVGFQYTLAVLVFTRRDSDCLSSAHHKIITCEIHFRVTFLRLASLSPIARNSERISHAPAQ